MKNMSNAKEEQKQHLIDMMRGDKELGLYEEAKRMYSEEEVKKLIINFLFERGIGREVENVEEWFEQFKKK